MGGIMEEERCDGRFYESKYTYVGGLLVCIETRIPGGEWVVTELIEESVDRDDDLG
jgi:hypothetical protein